MNPQNQQTGQVPVVPLTIRSEVDSYLMVRDWMLTSEVPFGEGLQVALEDLYVTRMQASADPQAFRTELQTRTEATTSPASESEPATQTSDSTTAAQSELVARADQAWDGRQEFSAWFQAMTAERSGLADRVDQVNASRPGPEASASERAGWLQAKADSHQAIADCLRTLGDVPGAVLAETLASRAHADSVEARSTAAGEEPFRLPAQATGHEQATDELGLVNTDPTPAGHVYEPYPERASTGHEGAGVDLEQVDQHRGAGAGFGSGHGYGW